MRSGPEDPAPSPWRWLAAAVLAQSAIGLLMSWLGTWWGPFYPTFWEYRLFHGYSTDIVLGGIPYRDVPIEYPPLVVPLILLPRLLASHFPKYGLLFGMELLAFNALGVWWVARSLVRLEGASAVPRRLIWSTAFFAIYSPFLVSKFDLVPTVLCFGAAALWGRGRSGAGGLMAGLGFLTKMFPVAPAVVGLLLDWRRPGSPAWRLRGVAVMAAVSAIGLAAWLALGGEGARDSLAYQSRRGIEMGSIYAGVLMLYGLISGVPMASERAFGCAQLLMPGVEAARLIAMPVTLALIALVAWRFRRPRPGDEFRGTLAVILALILGSKVFSPQFLIWPLPFVLMVPGRAGPRARWLFTAVSAFTVIYYLTLFPSLPKLDPTAIVLLNFRNLLFLGLCLLVLWGDGEPVSTTIPEVQRGDGRQALGPEGVSPRPTARVSSPRAVEPAAGLPES